MIYWCMYRPVGYAQGLTRVASDPISIYSTVVMFFFIAQDDLTFRSTSRLVVGNRHGTIMGKFTV